MSRITNQPLRLPVKRFSRQTGALPDNIHQCIQFGVGQRTHKLPRRPAGHHCHRAPRQRVPSLGRA